MGLLTKCKMYVEVHATICIIIEENVNHDHIPDSEKILSRQKLSMKRRAVDDSSDR